MPGRRRRSGLPALRKQIFANAVAQRETTLLHLQRRPAGDGSSKILNGQRTQTSGAAAKNDVKWMRYPAGPRSF